MRVEKRLITKISSYTPKQEITDPNGKTIMVVPQGEVQLYVTFEDEKEPQRVYYLKMEYLHGVRLLTYVPPDPQTDMYQSKNGMVAIGAEDMEYEDLG